MNPRFSDYVTSGAFSLALTRSQISSLSMAFGGETRYLAAAAALERKGLVEPISESPGHVDLDQRQEWRLTAAGALVLSLLRQAGLTNAGDDALAREADSLRRELDDARRKTHDAFLRVRSMQARIGVLEQKIEGIEAARDNRKINLVLRPRDPLPNATVEELCDPDRPIDRGTDA